MTDHTRGRVAPSPPPPFPGMLPEPAGAFAWNAPRQYNFEELDRSPSVIRYRNLDGEKRSISLFDYDGQKKTGDSEVRLLRRRLDSLPQYIRRYYDQKLSNVEKNQGNKKASSWLKNTFGRFVLPRIDGVNEKYLPLDTLPMNLMHLRDDLRRIPWAGKRELKKLAYRLADCLTAEFMRESDHQLSRHGDYEFAIISGYGRAGWLITHLNMTAPGWRAYCKEELTADDALRCVARIESSAWWLRRLRRLHDQWREHLMIAAGYVHKKATPYCSEPCLKEWQAQKKANREYINAMELEDKETGERISLADKVNGSVANKNIRRAELMARMRGFEDLAKADGLVGEFYTLTAPSKFHAMQQSGRRNNKYNGASPRETQRYLCNVWSKVRAKWKREGIRTFGFRVAEPHHDETPHWHALLFFKPDQVEAARAIFRKYALKVDGGEKGAQENRFKHVPIDEAFGSATGYIAKYISKNIDAHGLDGETDDETGELLTEMSARVSAWASRWNIRQFQQIGGAPVTVYRELGRLRDRDLWLFPEIVPAQVAAGEYDWAGYVTAQGGPLVPRDLLRVRLNYEVTENGNDYGDDVSHVTGVYSPFDPVSSVIFTRTNSYQIVPKAKEEAVKGVAVGVDLALSGGPAAPWSSVNNCTREPRKLKKMAVSSTVRGDHVVPPAVVTDVNIWDGVDFDKMTRKQRRAFNENLVSLSKKPRSAVQGVASVAPGRAAALADFAKSCGLNITELEANKLAAGEILTLNGKRWRAQADGAIRDAGRSDEEIKSSLMSRVYKLANSTRQQSGQK
ncbi:replication endonuclease [Erwinia sp. JH02]|uniref:replication endonuclease n=1 Tax=Erwinia sp. JH02 TaxID=2733394 RepID=UPI0014897587|nr:replication endonuclease [Erwinia sp. JH02]NNS09335.1 replication endonuclease [Erwinia sp. JH02]